MMEEQILKLPKWAQREIEDLRRALGYAEAKAKLLVEAQPKSKVWARIGGLSDDRRYLSEWDQISFDISGGVERHEITVSLNKDRDAVEVRSAWGQLAVIPSVSNVIQVKSIDR